MICKMGNFLKAYEKNFKRKKNGNDADLGSIYRTCGVVDLRSSDALRRETKYVNAQ